MRRIYPLTVVLAALAAILCGGLYLTGQQMLRQGANDPQIQIAEDAAARIATGNQIDLKDAYEVDAASSLAPFLITYDEAGKESGSNGSLHGKTPVLPAGVFDYVKKHHEDRFTWQPEPGVRLAAVIVYANAAHGGYALSARNLGEVEKRERQLLLESAAVLLACWLIIGAYTLLPRRQQ